MPPVGRPVGLLNLNTDDLSGKAGGDPWKLDEELQVAISLESLSAQPPDASRKQKAISSTPRKSSRTHTCGTPVSIPSTTPARSR